MKKLFSIVIIALISLSLVSSGFEENYQKPQTKDLKAMDKILNERLNLTQNQLVVIKKNHLIFKSKMDNIISEILNEQKQIKAIESSNKSKVEKDFLITVRKLKLGILKQKADDLKNQNRRNFEKVLTSEQKIEFDKIIINLQKNNSHQY